MGDRILPIDGLRGTAVLLVVAYHAYWSGPHGGGRLLAGTMELGWVGVDLFFVLSGFLISGILLRTRGQAGWLRTFYLRRAWRILPVYYLALALILGLLPLLSTWAAIQAAEVDAGWYAGFIANWLNLTLDGWPPGDPLIGHLWSLAVEEQFYLVWPLVVALAGPRRFASVCLVLIILAPLLRGALTLGGCSFNGLYPLTCSRMDALAWGGLLALQRFHGRWPGAAAGWACALAGGLGLVAAHLAWRRLAPGPGALLHAEMFSLTALAFAGTLVLALQPGGVVPRLLSWRPLCGLGFLSYGLYLLSMPLISLAGRLWPAGVGGLVGQALFLPLVLGGSVLLALASWHGLERRCLRQGRAAAADALAYAPHTRVGPFPS